MLDQITIAREIDEGHEKEKKKSTKGSHSLILCLRIINDSNCTQLLIQWNFLFFAKIKKKILGFVSVDNSNILYILSFDVPLFGCSSYTKISTARQQRIDKYWIMYAQTQLYRSSARANKGGIAFAASDCETSIIEATKKRCHLNMCTCTVDQCWF